MSCCCWTAYSNKTRDYVKTSLLKYSFRFILPSTLWLDKISTMDIRSFHAIASLIREEFWKYVVPAQIFFKLLLERSLLALHLCFLTTFLFSFFFSQTLFCKRLIPLASHTQLTLAHPLNKNIQQPEHSTIYTFLVHLSILFILHSNTIHKFI